MANLKEIRTKIASVKNTQKITKAMEMVAASKMRRTQTRMEETRPYADKIRTVIGHLYQANPEYRHPFLVEREIKRVGYIVITTDRGLCGGLNVNTFRPLLRELKEWRDKGLEVDLCLIGAKGVQFFRSLNVNVVGAATHLGEDPKVADLVGSIKIMLDSYSEGNIDRLFLMHSKFVNTMTQQPTVDTLIPVDAVDVDDLPQHWDYIYEPEAVDLLDFGTGALHRIPGLSRHSRECRVRDGGEDGRDEKRDRQCRQSDRRFAARLQQGSPGGHYAGNFRNRRRSRRGIEDYQI